MTGEDEEDSALLREMSKQAESFLRPFSWCAEILGCYFGGGSGGVLAVFLFNIGPTKPVVGQWIWIVVGDIPYAYLPLEDAETPAIAFKKYLLGMGRWVEMVRQGRSETPDDGVPPVRVPTTPEWADKIERRLHTLRLIVQPFFDDAGESNQIH